jgi:hypothetical protein
VPPRADQAAVRKYHRHRHHRDHQADRLQTRPEGGQVPGAGHRARRGHHAVDSGLGECRANAQNGGGGQQQPANAITGNREGDDGAHDRDHRDHQSERQRVGEHGGTA